MSKCFLVTGASGFIGRALSLFLKSRGFEVRALLRTPCDGPWDDCYVTDLEREGIPEGLMRSVHGVFHLAGVAHDSIDDSESTRQHYYRINVEATHQLLNLAHLAEVRRFVYFSSVKATGESSVKCLDEDTGGIPVDVYGRSKLEAERLVLEFGKNSGMHVSNIRPALVYGPGVKGNLAQMINGIKAGWFPPLPEFKNRRSMVSLIDVVEAAWLVANDARANGQTYIVSDGIEYSTRQIYQNMCNALGKPIPSWSTPRWCMSLGAAVGDGVERLLGQKMPMNSDKLQKLAGSTCYLSNKIRHDLGWRPTQTFAEVLPDMVVGKSLHF